MQLAALQAADEVDPVAAQIGAVNTLVRQADGSLKGYNTDWSAAIEAIEACMRANPEPDCDPEGCVLDFGDSWEEAQPQAGPSGREAEQEAADSPLAGRRVVVVGAGGAGRALAFGAAARGAHVIVANRCCPLIRPELHLVSCVPQVTKHTEQQHLMHVRKCHIKLSCPSLLAPQEQEQQTEHLA